MSDSSVEEPTSTPPRPDGAPRELPEALLDRCVGGLGDRPVSPELVELFRPDLR